MGQIIIDQELVKRGLTTKLLKKAIAITEEELQSHTIQICLKKTPKKKNRLFWEIVVNLDNKYTRVIGIQNYSEKAITNTIKSLCDVAESEQLRKPAGTWPSPGTSFITWLEIDPQAIAKQQREQKLLKKKQQREQKLLKEKQQREQKLLRKKKEKEARKNKLIPLALENINAIFATGSIPKNLDQECLFVKQQKFTDQDLVKKLRNLLDLTSSDFANLSDSATENDNEMISLWDKSGNLLIKVSVFKRQLQYNNEVVTSKSIQKLNRRLKRFHVQIEDMLRREKFTVFMSELPQSIKDSIKQLQLESQSHIIQMYTLTDIDRRFLKKCLQSNFYLAEIKADSTKKMQLWIEKWITRVKKAFSTPLDNSNSISLILGLVDSSPKYGIKTYASWLGKSKAKMLTGKKLATKYRHLFADRTIDSIAQEIEKLISDGLLRIRHIGKHDLPVLEITKGGKKLLSSKKTKRQKAKAKKPQPVTRDYQKLCCALENGERSIWIDFLKDDAAITLLKTWEQQQVDKLQQLLEDKMPGWEILTRWTVAKHPIKHKVLNQLLHRG